MCLIGKEDIAKTWRKTLFYIRWIIEIFILFNMDIVIVVDCSNFMQSNRIGGSGNCTEAKIVFSKSFRYHVEEAIFLISSVPL